MSNVMLSYITDDEDVERTFSRYLHMICETLQSIGLDDVHPSGHNDIMIGERKVSGNAVYHMPGKTIANDIPAYLALGVGYTPTDRLKLNVGFHFFDDKHATSYGHREKKLKRGTLEYNAGAEYQVNQCLTVSAGWQNTSYGLTKEYMDDKSFVANSNSVGAGVCLHLSEKMNLNLGYFHTFYGHVNGDAGNYVQTILENEELDEESRYQVEARVYHSPDAFTHYRTFVETADEAFAPFEAFYNNTPYSYDSWNNVTDEFSN